MTYDDCCLVCDSGRIEWRGGFFAMMLRPARLRYYSSLLVLLFKKLVTCLKHIGIKAHLKTTRG